MESYQNSMENYNDFSMDICFFSVFSNLFPMNLYRRTLVPYNWLKLVLTKIKVLDQNCLT